MLKIDVSLIVIFLIVWILVFLLTKLFFKPLQKIMQERESQVQKNRGAYQKSTEVYEQTICEIEDRLKSAAVQSQQTKENFERKALKEKERILEEVSTDCRSQVEKARRQLEKQLKSLKREFDSETRRLAERIEHKLLN